MTMNLDKTAAQTIAANTSASVDLGATVPLSVEKTYYSDSSTTHSAYEALGADAKAAQEAKQLQLAEYESGWKNKYLPGTTDNDDGVAYAGETGKLNWKCWKFVISYDLSGVPSTSGQTSAQVFDTYHTEAEHLDISVARTLIDSDEDGDADDDNSHNYGQYKIATAGADSWDGGTVASLTSQTLGAANDSTFTFYVFVFCDGTEHVYNDNAPVADFTVTIADAA